MTFYTEDLVVAVDGRIDGLLDSVEEKFYERATDLYTSQ